MGVSQARMFDCSAVAPVRKGEVWARTGVQMASAAIPIPMLKARQALARGYDIMASPAHSSLVLIQAPLRSRRVRPFRGIFSRYCQPQGDGFAA